MKPPTKLAPNRIPDAAAERAGQVITAMAQEGHITEARAKLALSRPAEAVKEAGAGSINYAADYVMDVLDDTVGAIDEDIVVTTTLSPSDQAAAEKSLTDELNARGIKFGVSQGAIVALDPGGGLAPASDLGMRQFVYALPSGGKRRPRLRRHTLWCPLPRGVRRLRP